MSDQDKMEPQAPERHAEPRRARGRPWLLTLALLAIVGGGAWYWFTGHAARSATDVNAGAAREAPGVPVEVAAAERRDVPVFLELLGTAQALNTVTIRSRVDGQIFKIAFSEGQTVKKGDLLVQIDPRPFQAALDQALAKRAQDEATLANNRLDLQRSEKLGEFATRQQLDTQRAAVSSQSAQIAADEAAIENARTQLDYATIRSPLDGRTGLRLIDEGNIVHAADASGIVEITQVDPIAVLFTAPEDQLAGITRAQSAGRVPVTALSSDGKAVLAEGELVLINNQVDAASGTVKLKAQFPNGEGRLWPGLSVNVRLLLKTLPDAVTVPSAAVQRGPDGLYVYAVGQDGKAERRPIEVGVFSQDRAVVEKGLGPGDRVVTAGQYRVTNGTKLAVNAAREAAPPAPGAQHQPGRQTGRPDPSSRQTAER